MHVKMHEIEFAEIGYFGTLLNTFKLGFVPYIIFDVLVQFFKNVFHASICTHASYITHFRPFKVRDRNLHF